MRRAALIALAVFAVAPARAEETARIRAGEHGGFSRVAIDLESVGAWSLRRDGLEARIRFPGREISFDGRRVFSERGISRVRSAVAGVDGDGTVLTLGLACECKLEAYLFGPDMLVVDVRDGAGTRRPDAPEGETGEAKGRRPAIPRL